MPPDPRPFELAFTSVEYLKSRNYKCDLFSPQGIGGVQINAVETFRILGRLQCGNKPGHKALVVDHKQF
jgi:hypothetical protein